MDDQLARRALPPLDRLPAEIRVKIFELILCETEGSTRVVHKGYQGKETNSRIVDTALLVALTNGHHHREACEVFYAGHFVELHTYRQFTELADGRASGMYITHLDLSNLASAAVFITKCQLIAAAQLPKLKELLVAFDGLLHTTTLREHLDNIGWISPRKLVCVGVGKYRVRFVGNKFFYFMHYGMRRRLQISQAEYAQSKGQRDVWKVVSPERPVLTLSPYRWAAAFDILTWFKARSGVGNTHDEDQTQFLEGYEGALVTRKSTDSVIAAMTGEVSFLDLDQAESRTSEVIEGMTDLLHINCGSWPGLGEGNGRYLFEQRRHKKMVDDLTMSTPETVDGPEPQRAP
ncbi:hypothetical protein LTR10_023514 [Elasticomyces elasticus]|nr:hypothetical protein LTR10_023514 [Elasticomyces elasticus]